MLTGSTRIYIYTFAESILPIHAGFATPFSPFQTFNPEKTALHSSDHNNSAVYVLYVLHFATQTAPEQRGRRAPTEMGPMVRSSDAAEVKRVSEVVGY